MKFLLNFSCLILFFVAEKAWGQDDHLAQKSYTIPVVKQKCFTSLVRLKINVSEEQVLPSFLKQITVSTKGTSSLSDIGSIKAYCNTDSDYLSEERLLQAPLFSTTEISTTNSNTLILNGELRLKPGNNFIWVGVALKQSANISNKIGISIISLKIDNHQIVPPLQLMKPCRIASAVRQLMQDNVNTSRIPGIATAKNGDLLAIFDARYDSRRDLQGDIDIALCRSIDKGNTWLPMQKIIDMGKWGGLPEKFNGVSDASILVDEKNGNIFVAGLWMHGVLDENGKWIEGLSDTSKVWNHQWKNKGSQPGFDLKQSSQFLLVKSVDNGETWSSPINITKICKKEEWWLLAPAPGRGFVLNDGTLVFPTEGRDKNGKTFSNITYSKNGGETWITSNPAVNDATTECAGVQLSNGTVMLNMRTNANKGITGAGNGRTVATTSDLGNTWSIHKTSRNALP